VIAAGSVSGETVAFVDILPTVCELTGRPLPAKAPDGQSILPVLRGGAIKRTRPLWWNYRRNVALLEGNWKIHANGKTGEFALFNVARDPRESEDVQAREPEIFARLRDKAASLQREMEAEAPFTLAETAAAAPQGES
jgi:arylsulfatase A-like enzyme